MSMVFILQRCLAFSSKKVFTQIMFRYQMGYLKIYMRFIGVATVGQG